MENTIENKQKFFALYWGQEVIYRKGEIKLFPVISANVHNMFEFGIDDECMLELTPLSAITNEDAVGIGYKSKEEFMEWFINLNEMLSIIESDKLRSLGYAVSFMGLSVETLIEYNWIKLKTP